MASVSTKAEAAAKVVDSAKGLAPEGQVAALQTASAVLGQPDARTRNALWLIASQEMTPRVSTVRAMKRFRKAAEEARP